METKWKQLFVPSCVLFASLALFLKLKSCESSKINKEIGSVEQVEVGIKPTVTIRPANQTSNNITRSLRDDTINLAERYVGISTASNGHIPVGDEKPINLSSIGTRKSVDWNGNTGVITYNWYGLSFGPGINYQTNGSHAGLGIDIRWLYIGDFATQAGIAFYKGQKVTPQVSIGYNLRRTKVLSNTDLIVGISGDKSIFGGIRCELGSYWRGK